MRYVNPSSIPSSTIIVIILSAIPATISRKPPRRPGPGDRQFNANDFGHLTDKLTHKILRDIEIQKETDPYFGRHEDDLTDAEKKEMEKKMTDECEFQCPEGLVAEDNPSFMMPTFKSCREYDESWDRIPGASSCCSKHQLCMHTCNRGRQQCDLEFGMCMGNICQELQEKGMLKRRNVIESCQTSMTMLGIMITETGCKMYPSAQRAACRCVENNPDDDDDDDGDDDDDEPEFSSLINKHINDPTTKGKEGVVDNVTGVGDDGYIDKSGDEELSDVVADDENNDEYDNVNDDRNDNTNDSDNRNDNANDNNNINDNANDNASDNRNDDKGENGNDNRNNDEYNQDDDATNQGSNVDVTPVNESVGDDESNAKDEVENDDESDDVVLKDKNRGVFDDGNNRIYTDDKVNIVTAAHGDKKGDEIDDFKDDEDHDYIGDVERTLANDSDDDIVRGLEEEKTRNDDHDEL